MNASLPLTDGLLRDRPALVTGGVTTGSAALHTRTLALARHFRAQGVATGDRVVLLVPPGPDFAASLLGLAWIGAVPVLLEPQQAPGAYAARIASVDARFAVVDPRLPWVWRIPGLQGLLTRRGRPIPPRPGAARWLPVPRHARGSVPPVDRSDDDDALIVFTSGTTSAPKAVIHTHGNLPHWLTAVRTLVGDLDLDSYLAETPQQIFYALLLGVTCHLVPGTGEARVAKAARAMQEHRIQGWFGSPWLWKQWVEGGGTVPDSLRAVLLGSSPVTRRFLHDFLPRVPASTTVRCVYGLTEIGPAATVDGREKADTEVHGDWVGRLTPSTRARIDDGVLKLASPALARRYGATPVGEWLDTGDLAELSERGIVLRGRSKDMILRRAVNLYPGVLEPLVQGPEEVALVGVYDHDRADERVVLCFVGPEPRDPAGALGPEAAPDHVLRVEAMPRSGRQNKVDKGPLRDLAREAFRIP
ncbi:MAG: class I adenylate-forming enzyme family protein [Myxococcota bacterium]